MVISAILLLILSIAVCFRRDKSIHFSRIVTITTIFCIILAMCNLYLIYLNNGVGLYGGLYHITSNTQVFNIFLLIVSGIILLLSGFYSRSTLNLIDIMYNRSKITNSKSEHYKILEYPLLLLFIVMGALLLMSTSDLVSIFLSIELQSYGLYLLSTIHRDSESGTKGGLTYFLLGGLSSCFILLSTALIYCNSGTTSLDGLYVISSISDIINNNQDIVYKSQYIDISLLILSVGFLFKVSSAPFHFWSPDVYDAIPTIVTTFVAIVAKISIFIFLLELVHYANSVYSSFNWTFGLLLSCLLSLLIGTIGGLRQFRIKRLFAYSTISHVGFILLALAVSNVESTQAFLFYVMQYSIVNLNAFFILITIGFSLYNYVSYNDEHKELLDKNNSPIQLVNQVKGYYYINPILALSLAITIFSFVGIPPLIGFFGKQMVLSAALDDGYVFLVLIAILTSVISAVYYLNVITQIYFNDTEHYLVNDTTKIKSFILSNSLCLIISLLTLTIILFMFAPKEWLSNANILALILFNP